jgi:hypothetical protein
MVWWSLMFAALLTFNGMLSQVLRTNARPPSWIVLPAFAVITAALVVSSWRASAYRRV